MASDFDFDPIKYGVLWQKVESYEQRFDQISKKQDKLEEKVEELLALANKGRGGLWAGMTVISAFSTLMGFLIEGWVRK
jgi:hypothetical protein